MCSDEDLWEKKAKVPSNFTPIRPLPGDPAAIVGVINTVAITKRL